MEYLLKTEDHSVMRDLKLDSKNRIKYAKRALDGIALGDCFGQSFFMPDETARERIKKREIVDEPWHFTDDTVMAIGIYRVLKNMVR